MKNNKMTMVERLIEGYEKAKKPIAYSVMIIAVFLGALPSEIIPPQFKDITFTSVLLILSLILMEILFELYEKIVKDKSRINQINSNELYDEIQGIVGNEKKVSIKFIGVAGRFGWQNVIEKLLNENDPNSLISNKTQFEIQMALLSPETCNRHKYFERFDAVSIIMKSIQRTAEILPEVAEPNSKLSLHVYDHMPNMLGFLINENYLFLTQTYWEYLRNELVLRAGGSDYFVYNKNDDFGGQELIKRFNGWFEFITEQSNQKDSPSDNE